MSQSLQRGGDQVTTFSLKTAQDLTNLQNSLFNLACNNTKLTSTKTIVKFQ